MLYSSTNVTDTIRYTRRLRVHHLPVLGHSVAAVLRHYDIRLMAMFHDNSGKPVPECLCSIFHWS